MPLLSVIVTTTADMPLPDAVRIRPPTVTAAAVGAKTLCDKTPDVLGAKPPPPAPTFAP